MPELMGKALLQLVAPVIVNRTVRPMRPPNRELRSREHLTEAEIDKLFAATRSNRYGHRDAACHLPLRPSVQACLHDSREAAPGNGYLDRRTELSSSCQQAPDASRSTLSGGQHQAGTCRMGSDPTESWVWMYWEACDCHHSAPLKLADAIARYGADASSNVLRQRSRCTKCGAIGATLRLPSWVDSTTSHAPFPEKTTKPQLHRNLC
jgi:hypothetical protein